MYVETFQPGPPDLTRMRESPSEVKFNIGIRIVYLPSAFVQREASVGFLYVSVLCRSFSIWFLVSPQHYRHNGHLTYALSRCVQVSVTEQLYPFSATVLCNQCCTVSNKLPM